MKTVVPAVGYGPRFQTRWALGRLCAGTRWLPVLLWLGVFGPLASMAADGLSARLDRNVVSVGETVTLTLAFENVAPQGPPQLPPIPGINVASVRQATELTIVQGQRTAQQMYHYTLVPTQPGDVTIPAISAMASGRVVSSQPLTLKILPANAPPAPGATVESAFLKLVVAKNRIYAGEVLPVQITLYAQAGQDVQLPRLEGEGFTVGKIQAGGQSRTRVNNQMYAVVPYQTYIAALRPGTLSLGPATLSLSIPKPGARRTIFGELWPGDWRQVTLNSEPVNLEVKPLPATNQPPGFGGAVGNFNLSVNAGPTNVAVGDPITMRVQIAGNGLLDSLNLPSKLPPDRFKSYPPTSKIDLNDPLGISGTKTFEQVVIPLTADVDTLPPIQFAFFDPQSGSYRSLSNRAIALQVRTALAASVPSLTNSANRPTSPAADDILPIKIKGNVAMASGPLAWNPWFIWLQGLPLALWLGLLWRRKQREHLQRNPRLVRQRQVHKRIREGLSQLPALASGAKAEDFFAEVFRMLQEQIGERLDLPASAITEAVVHEHLEGRGLPADTIRELQDLFQSCNQSRYGRQQSTEELVAVIPRLESVLGDLQRLAP